MEEYFIGIDLGGTNVKIGLVRNHEIVSAVSIPAKSAQGLQASLPLIEEGIEKILSGHGLKKDALKGIAIGFPGLVDNRTKKILSTNKKYDDALTTDLQSWVTEKWNIPLVIENDARAAAMAEWKYGAGKGSNNIISITIGTGIGSAAIIEGQLLRGKHFQAGVLGGHISLNYKGRKCTCGNIGCAEAHGGTWSLPHIITISPLFGTSILKQALVLDFETLFAAASENDPLALEVMEDCIEVWSAAIVNLIHAYDPELVILGGGVLKSADKILPPITRRVHALALDALGQSAHCCICIVCRRRYIGRHMVFAK